MNARRRRLPGTIARTWALVHKPAPGHLLANGAAFGFGPGRRRNMTCRLATPVLILLSTLVAEASAHTVSLRVGPGIAYADGKGWSGLLALEARWRVLVLRADTHMLYVPVVAEVGHAGVAAGAAPLIRHSAVRPYVLATVSRGIDIREGDEFTTAGVAAGLDWLRSRFFAELRYENSLQRADPLHYTLPEHQWTLCAGLRIGRSSWQTPPGP